MLLLEARHIEKSYGDRVVFRASAHWGEREREIHSFIHDCAKGGGDFAFTGYSLGLLPSDPVDSR